MKSKFGNIILFIVMLLLIGAVVVFGMAIYANVMNLDTSNIKNTVSAIYTSIMEDSINTFETTNSVTIGEEDSTKSNNLENVTDEKYYYNQLTDVQKRIYDGLEENKENMYSGTYVIQYGDIFTDVLSKEDGSAKLGKDYQSAVETFLFDNPDVFYIDANKLFISIETTSTLFKKKYNVYIGPAEGKTYYVDGFKSDIQVKAAMKKIESIRDDVMSRLTGNTYRDILKIHDYLVESIDYDSNTTSIGSYSIYGALIDKKCVCEGYAKALKYLLNSANIPCEIAQGTAINSSGKTESHAWNIVKIDKKWYYIDATWNDPIIIGDGTVAKSIQYKYFLKGSKTFDKDHILSNSFSDGGRTYKYPKVEEYNHK